MPIIGAAKTALDRLPIFWRQALKQSTLVDIETTGLDPAQGHFPVSGAQMRYGEAPAEEAWFTFESAKRSAQGKAKRQYTPVTEKAMKFDLMEPFSRAQWEAKWAEARAEWMAKHPNVPMPARKWFSKLLAREAKAGRFVWTHNVQFDITRFGSQFAHPAAIDAWRSAEVGQVWSEFEPMTSELYASTTEEMFGIGQRVWREPRLAVGAQRHWYGQYRRLVEEAVETGKPMLADSLAMTRAMFGMAQERGAMPHTGDIFTGSSLDALMAAFRIPEPDISRAHEAAYDIEQRLQHVMPHIIETSERLYAGEPLTIRQMRALQTIGEMQPEMAAMYAERNFASARIAMEKYGSFPLRGRQRGTDLNELLALMEEKVSQRAYAGQFSLAEIKSRVDAMTAAELEEVALSKVRLPTLSTTFEMGNVVKAGGRRMRQALSGRNPWLMAGVAVASMFVAGKVLGPKREDHNVIRGFQNEEGMTKHQRELLTDFGSGFRMDRAAIHPDILKFREEKWKHKDDRDKIKAQIENLSEKYQARMGRFQEEDFTTGDSSIVEGINRARKDLRFVNLSKFNMQVEDADTVMLQRKGTLNWLKAQFGFGQTVVRLEGIDSPEMAGHSQDVFNKLGLRWRQEQPHAAESTEMLRTMLRKNKNIALLSTPDPETYGRHLGVLATGGGKNINLELIRQGAARKLFYGKKEMALMRRDAAESAETEAIEESTGMWQHARYLKHKTMEDIRGKQVSFNLLTRMDVLASSAPMAMMATELTALEGDKFFAHQPYGMGHTMRKLITDFGSFHRGTIAMARRLANVSGDIAGQYWPRSRIREHISWLRGLIAKQANLAKGGTELYTVEMSAVEVAEYEAALAKFEAVEARPEGARIMYTDHVEGMTRAEGLNKWKRGLKHEDLHEAFANVDEMRLHLNDVKINRHTMEEFRRQGYSLGDETFLSHAQQVEAMTAEEFAAMEQFHREEIVNFMIHPEAMEGVEWLENTIGFEMMESGRANRNVLDRIKQMNKEYHRKQRIIDGDRARAAKRATITKMNHKTMSTHAPAGGPPGVRLNDSPGIASAGGVGEVQRMFRDRKRSGRMHQP